MDRNLALLTDAQALHRDDDMRLGPHDRGHQRPRELRGRHDYRLRAAVVEDMLMIAFGVGRIGRHGDAARCHDAKVGDAPFGPVLADQHHPVAFLEAEFAQIVRERRHLIGDLPPAQRLPRAIGLAPQEGIFATTPRAVEEHRDQARKMVEMGIFKLHSASLQGDSLRLFCFRWGKGPDPNFVPARRRSKSCRDRADRRRPDNPPRCVRRH